MFSRSLACWLNRALLDELLRGAQGVLITEGPAVDGLVARYYPSGQLASLANHFDGSAASAWALYLEEGVEKGTAVLERGLGGTPDREVYADGRFERFDAWSDNSPAQRLAYAKWVRRWIAAIVDDAQRRAEHARRAARARAALPVRDDDDDP